MALPPLPAPSHPMVDPKTGLMDKIWFQYLRALDRELRALL